MAELLVRVVDKVNADFYLNCKCTKRGDVVVVCPDGWPWGSAELTSTDYRIFAVAGVKADDLTAFLAPELDADPKNPSSTLQSRVFRLDVDAFAATLPDVAGELVDGKRMQGVKPIAVDLATLLSFKVKKPPIADPKVIG